MLRCALLVGSDSPNVPPQPFIQRKMKRQHFKSTPCVLSEKGMQSRVPWTTGLHTSLWIVNMHINMAGCGIGCYDRVSATGQSARDQVNPLRLILERG